MNVEPKGQGRLKKLLTHEEVNESNEQALNTHKDFLEVVGEISFGNDPVALATHDQFGRVMQKLATHVDPNKPLEDEIPRVLDGMRALDTHDQGQLRPLDTHVQGLRPLDTHDQVHPQPLDTHKIGKLQRSRYKLEEGTFSGLHIVAWKIILTQALRNCAKFSALDPRGVAIKAILYPAASYFFGLGNTTGYSDEEYKNIVFEQVQLLKENLNEIVWQLRYTDMTQLPADTLFYAAKTGGMLMTKLTSSAGTLEWQLRQMVRINDELWENAEGNSPEEKAEFFKENYIGSIEDIGRGAGFFRQFEQLRTVVFDAYEKRHPVLANQVEGEDGHIITVYKKAISDNPGIKEAIARDLVAWSKNHGGAKSAKGFERHLKAELQPTDYESLKTAIESVIQEAIQVSVLDPYEPDYESSQTPEEILQAEFDACRFNMREEDRRLASKVVEQLLVFRGMGRGVEATKLGETKPSYITRDELNKFIKEQIQDEKLDWPPSYTKNSNFSRIIDEELVAYQLQKPKNAPDDYETRKAFKEYLAKERDIYNKEGVGDGAVRRAKISEKALDSYLSKLANLGVLQG